MSQELKLCDFDISKTTGFVATAPPLVKLPGEYFSQWEDVCAAIPHLVKQRQLRANIEALPDRKFSEETLQSEEEWRRAYVLLTFLSQSYIWAEGEARVVDTLPKKLAVPWCTVSEHVTLKPVATYASVVLYNYRLCDPNGGLTADNLVAISNFTGTEDESWFYMVHMLVELAAVPGLNAIERVFQAMKSGQNSVLVDQLQIIEKSIYSMRETLKGMYKKCKPSVFYVNVRPFLAGTQGISLFPNGLVYEGVDCEPRRYCGGSAAQTTSIPSFDTLLGIKHLESEDSPSFMEKMREYQPKQHRNFLVAIENQQPSLRDYITESQNPELIKQYNRILDALIEFRKGHMKLISVFVIMQSEKHGFKASEANGKDSIPVQPPNSEDGSDTNGIGTPDMKAEAKDEDTTPIGKPVKALAFKGTGGTALETFLDKIKNSTEAMKIPLPG